MNSKRLNIALVAHDARKNELIEWCIYNADMLKQYLTFSTLLIDILCYLC